MTGSRSELFVKIRKEKFGYIFFERFTREHYFVSCNETLENFSESDIEYGFIGSQ
jgi:hypothetical protein